MLLIKSAISFLSKSPTVVDISKVCHWSRNDSIWWCIGQGFSALHLRNLKTQEVNSSGSPVRSTNFSKVVSIVISLMQKEGNKLKLYYSSREVSKGRLLAIITVADQLKARK